MRAGGPLILEKGLQAPHPEMGCGAFFWLLEEKVVSGINQYRFPMDVIGRPGAVLSNILVCLFIEIYRQHLVREGDEVALDLRGPFKFRRLDSYSEFNVYAPGGFMFANFFSAACLRTVSEGRLLSLASS